MQELDERCVLFFVKEPGSGNVKTRLAARLGCETASELCKCFLLDMLNMLNKLLIPFEIVYYPPQSEIQLKNLFGNSYRYTPQQGGDLGQRMKNAFSSAFNNGYEKVVLIGSDLPDLPDKYIKYAFIQLENSDVVIGPAADSGYYLIGFSNKSFVSAVFENISWSTSKVFEQTLCALKKQSKTVSILPTWNDIDTIDDLRRFVSRNVGTASRTFSYISKQLPQLNDMAEGENYTNV